MDLRIEARGVGRLSSLCIVLKNMIKILPKLKAYPTLLLHLGNKTNIPDSLLYFQETENGASAYIAF